MKKDIHTLKWILHASNGFKGRILLMFLLGLMRILLSLASVWFCKELLDIATNKSDKDLSLYIGLLIGALALQLILGIITNWLDGVYRIKHLNQMQYRIYTQVMQMPWNGNDKFHSGDMVNRLLVDLGTINDFICGTLPSLGLTISQLIGASTLLYILQPTLLWIILCIMPFTAILSRIYLTTMRKLTARLRENGSKIQSTLQESLLNRITIIALGGIKQTFTKLRILQDETETLTKKRLRFSIFSSNLVRLGLTLGYGIAFIWGVLGIKEGVITFGTMTAFMQLVTLVQGPFADMAHHIPAFVHTLTAADRIRELTKDNGCIYVCENEIKLEDAGIKVKDLSFGYAEDKSVISNLTYDFTPGSHTAIMGKTGAGKSTLAKLMMALLQHNCGEISIYNEQETCISSAKTRCNFSYVPQGNSLFSGTIRENLLLGNPSANEEQMKHALYLSASDFVDNLDAPCHEKGGGLSEGQAQRIAIARALLHQGSILIMDEASSALDEETEKTILHRLKEDNTKRTIIWVTHHANVAKAMDNLVTL